MREALPVPVLTHPHWRVIIRPASYEAERIKTLSDCVELVEQAKVSLRGWDFPHLSIRKEERLRASTWVGGHSASGAHLEYWRLYLSGQFLYLGAVREALEPQWRAQLVQAAAWHHGAPPRGEWKSVPGFFSILNFLYTMTEVFEFAARLAQRGVYDTSLTISVGLHDIRGFVLLPDTDRAWSEYCAATEAELSHEWSLTTTELVAGSAAKSLEATVWFFERFGWVHPNRTVREKDQEKFLLKQR